MLHHPHAWPRQEAALGLLISLRKFYQTVWVRQFMRLHRPPAVMMLPACCLVFLHLLRNVVPQALQARR